MKRDFKRAKRHYYNNKLDNNRRIEFIKQRNKYKKIKYLTERYQKDDNLYKLAMIENKQPNLFWKSIKSLMPKKYAESQIHSKDWISYFSELLNFRGSEETQNEGYQFREYIKHSIPVLEKGMPSVGPLDNNITEEEFIQAIRQLKNNKAVGPDNICNEILKCNSTHLYGALKHLFNIVIKNGNYPKSWMFNIITPIHKSGAINNPQNYRGIAVCNSMNKVFTKILNKRIYEYLGSTNFWSPNQNGFMKGRRTDDNIFIIHSIFQKYVKQRKRKIYVAFVDFRKFFDSINRNCLLYKLIKCGIICQMYNVIKASYNQPLFCIKTKYGLSEYFTSNTGVKQGCILSPVLSNIFQNDLHECFDETCEPAKLHNISLNSLSWADDLVLIQKLKKDCKSVLINSIDTVSSGSFR